MPTLESRLYSIKFQSTLPARGATRISKLSLRIKHNFNPRSPRGERHHSPHLTQIIPKFQSTLPARGATAKTRLTLVGSSHFNPRSPRGERHKLILSGTPVQNISIHAPREGSDVTGAVTKAFGALFQSTLPARGATRPWRPPGRPSTFQSTLPARGATPTFGCFMGEHGISIHAPREGSDLHRSWRFHHRGDFNPRSPRGERRRPLRRPQVRHQISIHAPREGSDHGNWFHRHPHLHFNPRSPRGERPGPSKITSFQYYFNPRSPRGERQQMCTNIHLQACKTSIKFNLAPQKPSNHTALILRKKGAVLVRSSQVMYGH